MKEVFINRKDAVFSANTKTFEDIHYMDCPICGTAPDNGDGLLIDGALNDCNINMMIAVCICGKCERQIIFIREDFVDQIKNAE